MGLEMPPLNIHIIMLESNPLKTTMLVGRLGVRALGDHACPVVRREGMGGMPTSAWLRTNGVNTNGAAAKVIFLTDWGKRCALALFGI